MYICIYDVIKFINILVNLVNYSVINTQMKKFSV